MDWYGLVCFQIFGTYKAVSRPTQLTFRYLDDLLNIDNPYFEQMVVQIYPAELQLNKANSSDTEAPFLDLNLSITNGIILLKFMINRMILILK